MKTTNTTKNQHPEWLFGKNPNAIERQEQEGQKQFVESQQLPKKCNYPRKINAAEQYHKMGIKVLTGSKGDDLFLGVSLPAGWVKKETDHSMWSALIDDKGRERASLFYKAAFYDRDAFVNFTARYKAKHNYSVKGQVSYEVIDTSTGNVIFSAGVVLGDGSTIESMRQKDLLDAKCVSFLNDNFPEWEDINAYW